MNGEREGTRAQQKQATRRALLEAAAHEFAHWGFAGARVERIAARAGVTTGALYAQFAGKDGLFLAVYEDYAAERVREVRHAGAVPDARQAARQGADDWMARFDAQPWGLMLHMEFAGHASRDPDLRADFAERVSAVRAAIEDVVRRAAAQSAAEPPLSPQALATVIRALGLGLAAERLVDPDRVPAALFGEFVELLLELLFPPPTGGPVRQEAD